MDIMEIPKDILKELRASGGRKLTAGEKQNCRLFYHRSIDVNKVTVQAHTLSKDTAFTLNNDIYFPRAAYQADFSIADPSDINSSTGEQKIDLAWLVHEFCHVWQYQNRINGYTWMKALLETLRYGSHVYDYDINEHDCFDEYRFEQEGAIIQTYSYWYLLAGGHPDNPVADRHRAVINCSIPWPGIKLSATKMKNVRLRVPQGLKYY